ncbi:hypothetical protein GQR58_018984 [Nymphon striatum]|nr:hypothetical protein GQR58_018984 [Nymphon striatum]
MESAEERKRRRIRENVCKYRLKKKKRAQEEQARERYDTHIPERNGCTQDVTIADIYILIYKSTVKKCWGRKIGDSLANGALCLKCKELLSILAVLPLGSCEAERKLSTASLHYIHVECRDKVFSRWSRPTFVKLQHHAFCDYWSTINFELFRRNNILEQWYIEGKRSRGRQRTTFIGSLNTWTTQKQYNNNSFLSIAENKSEWRTMIANVCPRQGNNSHLSLWNFSATQRTDVTNGVLPVSWLDGQATKPAPPLGYIGDLVRRVCEHPAGLITRPVKGRMSS